MKSLLLAAMLITTSFVLAEHNDGTAKTRHQAPASDEQIASSMKAWASERNLQIESVGRSAHTVYYGMLGGWITRIDYIAALYRMSRLTGETKYLQSARDQVKNLYENGDKALYDLTKDEEFRPPFRSNWDRFWGTAERKNVAPSDNYPLPRWTRETSWPTWLGGGPEHVARNLEKYRRRCELFGGRYEQTEPREVYAGRQAFGGRGYGAHWRDTYKLSATATCNE